MKGAGSPSCDLLGEDVLCLLLAVGSFPRPSAQVPWELSSSQSAELQEQLPLLIA